MAGGTELVLHHQPIIDLQSGALTEFEALVRWQHPERGLVSLGDFVPIAEDLDLIGPMGHRISKVLFSSARGVTILQSKP